MKILKTRAYARAGLLGNPSDGFFGKTISAIVKNFSARVVLYEWPELEILLSQEDRCEFDSVEDLVEDVRLRGLYGGLRLVKAAVKKFAEHCEARGIRLPKKNFSLRYETDIPRQVGLAGSSAIITAVLRALMGFYEIEIPREILPSLVLSVETEEIGIQAGLQDRVCQVYEGVVYMDFDRELLEARGHGRYESLDPACLPPLYVAYREDLSKISGVYHSNLRARWEARDPKVVEGMRRLAEIAEEGRSCIARRDHARLGELMDRNFDARASMMQLDPRSAQMVYVAREAGVPANYAGSGGAIVGICPDEATFQRLGEVFARIGCKVIRPMVA
ncbi:MAG: mevalonate kinase family protein [Planctomycetota bacterium]